MCKLTKDEEILYKKSIKYQEELDKIIEEMGIAHENIFYRIYGKKRGKLELYKIASYIYDTKVKGEENELRN